MLRRVVLGVVLAAPFAVSWAAAGSAIDAATGFGAQLRHVVQPWLERTPEPQAVFVTADDRPISEVVEPSVARPAATSPKTSRRVARRSGAPTTPRDPAQGLFVSASRVLEIARSGIVPRGVPVPASDGRPAGILLTDVERLGVGLRNGDVLVSAVGAPARVEEDVVTAVLSARKRRAEHVAGRFWRAGQEWALVVQMPYLQRGGSANSSPATAFD